MIEQTKAFLYEKETPCRLDLFLVGRLTDYSRSRIQSLIKNGYVLVNGQVVSKAGWLLLAGAVVQVHLPPPSPVELVPENLPLEIVFEDDNVIVINKPAGMVVHPSAGHGSGTLVHAVLAHAPDIAGVGGKQRPGIVHRLDRDTSGLILVAKNDATHQWLQDQFRKREIEKVYLALVDGHPPTLQGRIEASIGRDDKNRKRMAIVPDERGRQAITIYHVLKTFPKHALLEVRPLTGRTHQIRLHLAFLGCPVVGDTVYGQRRPSLPVKRQFLHAARINVLLPGETVKRIFEATLPDELASILNML